MNENCKACRLLSETNRDTIEKELKRLKASSVPLADETTRDNRLTICSGCKYLDSSAACLMCGCYVFLRSALPGGKCPMDYW